MPSDLFDKKLATAVELLEKKEEMKKVEENIRVGETEFQIRMEVLNYRKKQFEQKEFTLKEAFAKFDEFLKVIFI